METRVRRDGGDASGSGIVGWGEGAVECFERVGEMRAGDGRLVVVREEHESTATGGWDGVDEEVESPAGGGGEDDDAARGAGRVRAEDEAANARAR